MVAAVQPDEIHLVSSDSIFHDGNHRRPGLWTTFSSKPKSANYHPQNFNRAARALRDRGLLAPDEVLERDRRLNCAPAGSPCGRAGALTWGWSRPHGRGRDPRRFGAGAALRREPVHDRDMCGAAPALTNAS